MPSFALSPASGSSGGTYTVTATGTGTAWDASVTFSVSGGAGSPAISGLDVTGIAGQVAVFTLFVGTAAATLTISDSEDADTATFAVATPAVATGVAKSKILTRQQLNLQLVGALSTFLSSTTWSVSGGNATIVSQRYVSPSQFYLHVFTGTAAGTLTFTNTTDDSTFTVIVNKAVRRRKWGAAGPLSPGRGSA